MDRCLILRNVNNLIYLTYIGNISAILRSHNHEYRTMLCKARPFLSTPLNAMWFETTAFKRVKHWQPSTWNTLLYLLPADLWVTYLICDFPLTRMCARCKTDRPTAAKMWTLNLGLGLSICHAIRSSHLSWTVLGGFTFRVAAKVVFCRVHMVLPVVSASGLPLNFQGMQARAWGRAPEKLAYYIFSLVVV